MNTIIIVKPKIIYRELYLKALFVFSLGLLLRMCIIVGLVMDSSCVDDWLLLVSDSVR